MTTGHQPPANLTMPIPIPTTLSFPPLPPPPLFHFGAAGAQGLMAHHHAMVHPGLATTSADQLAGQSSLADQILHRLGDGNGDGSGCAYIRRELKSLPNGGRMQKKDVIECAIWSSSIPSIDPAQAKRQCTPLPHGIQITSVDRRAHVKVQLGSGLVEICGRSPHSVLHLIESWTTECNIAPRSNKRRK